MPNIFDSYEKRLGKRTALVEEHVSYSYEAVAERVASTAGLIRQFEVAKNDFIVIAFSNVKEFVFAYFAVLKSGCIPVLVNPESSVERIGFIIKDIGAKGFLGHGWVFQKLVEAMAFRGFVILDKVPAKVKEMELSCHSLDELQALPASHGGDYHGALQSEAETGCQEPHAVIYTSGTTSDPKGVLLSGKNLLYSSKVIIDRLELTSNDCGLISMPFSQCAGLLHLLAHLQCGARVVTGITTALPGHFLKSIAQYNVTTLPAVPALILLFIEQHEEMIVKYCQELRVIELSSSSYQSHLINHLFQSLPKVALFNTYGLTEAVRATYHRLVPGNSESFLSIGTPNPEVKFRIRNEKGRECEPGEKGEVHLSGPNVALGYWDGNGINKKAFENNCFRTGDFAYRDHAGMIYLTGRQEEIIRSKAGAFFPIEIEERLVMIDGIHEVAAFGIPSTSTEDLIHVKIVKNKNALIENVIPLHCQKYLPRHQIPHHVDFCDMIPKTESGKVDRKRLIQEALL